MSATKLKSFYVLDILRKYSDSEHRLTAENICSLLKSEYSVSAERKGIYRDIDALGEYGVDIKKTSTGFFVDTRVFRVAEIRLLVSAIQAASFITPDKAAMLTEKLSSQLSVHQAEQIIGKSYIGVVKYESNEVYKTIETVNNAISGHRQLSFYYYKKNLSKQDVPQHNGTRYLVSPYAMIWHMDNYYLVCNSAGHEGLTHFRIDRIKGAYPEQIPWRHFSEVSEYKLRFDASDYAKKCINMFGGEITTVTLRCKNARITEILDKFGNSTPLRRDGNEHFITIVDVAMSTGFLSWVAQFFDGIEIISPASARNALKEYLKQTLTLYE